MSYMNKIKLLKNIKKAIEKDPSICRYSPKKAIKDLEKQIKILEKLEEYELRKEVQ